MEVRPGYKQTEVGVIPEEWVVKKIGELCEYQNGTSLEKFFNRDDGLKVISIGNYGVTGIYIDNGNYISFGYRKIVDKYVLRQNDLTMSLNDKTAIGAILGRVLLIDQDDLFVFNQRTMRLSPKANISPAYLYHTINADRVHSDIVGLAKPGTQIYINTDDVIYLKLPIPPLPEQQAIAAALSDVDVLLAKLDQLIAKKRDLKQAAMQQLLTGKTRLPGFTGAWEMKRLGKMLHVRHGKSQHHIVVHDGRYPILATGGEIGRTNTFLYDKPSVLIGRKGTIDKPQYRVKPFWTVDTLFYTEILGDTSAKFIYYKFNTINWRSYNEASGVPSLNASTIENIEVKLPKPNEQAAIAAVLSDMDAEIAALEARRDKTRALKQGMMQELLTGRIRLVPPNNPEN